jgi:hypothetical protein
MISFSNCLMKLYLSKNQKIIFNFVKVYFFIQHKKQFTLKIKFVQNYFSKQKQLIKK